MLATEPRPMPGESLDIAPIRDAFLDMHGRSLHGFALLMCLGDRRAAAELAGSALAAATDRLGELRHPERAAAWLRARVVRTAPRRSRPDPDGLAALAEIGADEGVVRALAPLRQRERAALVATAIERFDPLDVAVIVARSGARLDALLATARRRYLAAYLRSAPEPQVDGPIMVRVHHIARQVIA